VKAITDVADAAGKDFSALANELLCEAVAMRRCPGIAFMDGASGRRAVIAGTGVDVWEVVYAYEHADRDFTRLRQAFNHIAEPQLRAALAYATLYPKKSADGSLKTMPGPQSALPRSYRPSPHRSNEILPRRGPEPGHCRCRTGVRTRYRGRLRARCSRSP